MKDITIALGQGTASAIDPSLTKKLQESVGVVYQPGDPSAHKFPGRSVFNSTPMASAVVRFLTFTSNGLFAVCNSDLHISNINVPTFTSIGTFESASLFDAATLNDVTYFVSATQSDNVAPFGALVTSGSTAYRLGLSPQITPPVTVLVAGPGITGSFKYWTTEYDSTHAVESAFDFNIGSPSAAQPINQDVRLTRPAVRNASADKWRIYRTIDNGAAPIGWLVAEVAIATTTYDDQMTDADLVLQEPYRIITINGIPESMDMDPQVLAIQSIDSFQGSLVGAIGVVGADLAYTPALEPHSWPDGYRIVLPTTYSGTASCVRKCGDVLYACTQSEVFLINYLPDETDSIFSPDISVEHVANYGTLSPTGMCSFTAWGGQPVLFLASTSGPILISGKTVDRAVSNISWGSLVSQTLLQSWKVIDNPSMWRVEMYYRDSTSDASSWKCLHFYYDMARVQRESGFLPEMAWTGPHPVPGPGCFALASSSTVPASFTASQEADGTVYREDSGTSDAANLIDADGTIQFRMRTPKVYPGGIDAESRADRLFIHKYGTGSQDFTTTFTAYRENGSSKEYPMTIDGDTAGSSSNGLNASMVAFDVRIVADGTSQMAPINNVTVRYDEQGRALKTTVT